MARRKDMNVLPRPASFIGQFINLTPEHLRPLLSADAWLAGMEIYKQIDRSPRDIAKVLKSMPDVEWERRLHNPQTDSMTTWYRLKNTEGQG